MKSILNKGIQNKETERISNSNTLTDYNIYLMSKKEKAMYSLGAVLIVFIVALIFYHSYIISAIICPIGFLYPKLKVNEIKRKRKSVLNLQFKDMLYSLSSSISSGRSIESAFPAVLSDLAILYPDPKTDILIEVECIIYKINLNETVETALLDLAERAHLEDIDNFVDVFHISKRTGGNINEIIKNASNIINDKIEIKQEIDTLLAERKFEQRVLNVLPILLVIVLTLSAGDYINPIFSTAIGRAAMTISVILLASAYVISKKIMDIRV